MRIIKKIKDAHPDLFCYILAEEVHPHDRFLYWTILRWLPDRVTPNLLTVCRIVMVPVVFFFVGYGQYQIGILLFLLAALTDALDGSLARTTDRITRFGMLFDPLADKLLIGTMVLLVVFQNFHYLLGIAILGIEIIFITSALVAKVKFKTIHMANRWGKIKMLLQVLAVFLTLLAMVFQTPYLFTIASWMFGLAIGFAVVSLFRYGI